MPAATTNPDPLSNFIATTVSRSTSQEPVNHLPDGRTRLIFRLLPDGGADLHVFGPRTRAAYKRPAPTSAFVMVTFQPGGGYPFFGVPAAELVDQARPLADVWGPDADQLLARLVTAGTNAARIDVVKRALERRRCGPDAFEPLAAPVAREAVARLAETSATIPDVTRELNLSDRSLRRAFHAVVGLSPKQYQRIARFQRVLSGTARQTRTWAEVAAANGYFDQAHLTAEFREFARLPPTAFGKQAAADDLRYACR